jgi:hypothetical protein
LVFKIKEKYKCRIMWRQRENGKVEAKVVFSHENIHEGAIW